MFLRVLFFTTLVAYAQSDMTVKMVHVLFRHGDKVPHSKVQNYPNDPYRDRSYYPIEDGGLTNHGMRRVFKLGKLLRSLYDGFLGPIYSPSKVYARSTAFPRTRMSLQLVLAGLFPPSKAQMWNPDLPWIPVSTFCLPLELDYLLIPELCPRYIEEFESMWSRRSHVFINSRADIMQYLTDHAGKNFTTSADANFLYGLLKEQAAQNLTLPEWTHSVYPKTLKEMAALDFNVRSHTKILKRLNGGMFLRRIIDDVFGVINEDLKYSKKNLFLFGAHEFNIAAFSKVLGLKEPDIPLYSSAFIIETLIDDANMWYLRVRLWSGETEQLETQSASGCGEFCLFGDFIELHKELLPNDAEYNCGPGRDPNITRAKAAERFLQNDMH